MKHPQHWLMKSEPDTYSLDDLKHAPHQSDIWDGVRNYQARNFMRQMAVGDIAFFYHSNCKTPGIVGSMRIKAAAQPDPTALDIESPYFDSKSTLENNRWSIVTVQYEQHLPFLSLQHMKTLTGLEDFPLLQRGNRLSVMPVSDKQAQILWHYFNAQKESS